MSTPTTTKQWLVTNKPKEFPVLDGPNATFTLHTERLPALEDGQILLKALHVSNDPAQRGWISATMDPDRLYAPLVGLNEPMRACVVAEVIESRSAKLKKGDRVTAWTGWSEYTVVPAEAVTPIGPVPKGLSDTHFLGSLGLTGLTAYYGLAEIVKARPTDRIVVSGAAGATGSMVVQIAKRVLGCARVIGIAGSPEKCRWVESLGADVCINYKDADFEAQLRDATPGYATVFYDNVGGAILDAMLMRIAPHGRVAACGSISDYNAEGQEYGLKNWYQIISNRITIHGYIVTDGATRFPDFLDVLTRAIESGAIRIDEKSETIVPTTFEDIPKTWMRLFGGGSQGKLISSLKN